VVVWAKTAENCAQYLSKGRQAYIEGRLQTRSWEDRDGNKRYTTEVVAREVQFLGGGAQGGGGQEEALEALTGPHPWMTMTSHFDGGQ
jgi:single-strand DNA-binding protein